jgi:hypothetical protein
MLRYRLTLPLLLALSPVAHGEDATPEQRFLADTHLQQNIITVAAKSLVMERHVCAKATYKAGDPVEIAPMKFNELAGPVAGELRFPVHEEGCGASHELNVYLWVQRENSIAITPMLPGSSHAVDMLQKSAYAYALAAAGGPEANCKTAYVEDTQFQSEVAGKGDKGGKALPWKEVWTLSSCGWRAEVPVTFTPGPKGTKITAGPKSAVKKLPPDNDKS